MVDALVEGLNLESFRKLYKECGRSPYHPKMMLKVILYAYMNNIYSCRKIEKLLHRDIHYIWLAGYEKPDFITIYNPQIQISAESETKRSIFREKDKTKRSKKESAQHSKSRNKSFVMTSVSAL